MSIRRFGHNIGRPLSSEWTARKVAQNAIGCWSCCETRGKDDEFVAAKARNDIFLTHDLLHEARKLLQDRIALKMPIGVVDALEIINVDRNKRAWARFGAQRGFDAIDRS